MPNVAWDDDSIRIRLFQTAVRTSAHFYDAIASVMLPEGEGLFEQLEELHNRWLSLTRRQECEASEYPAVMQSELLPLRGHPIFDYIRTELGKPFECAVRLEDINQKALNEALACIKEWGGPKARRRAGKLTAIPLLCKTGEKEQMEFSFERADGHILIRTGSAEGLLLECMLLQFSLFHEYLSHAFPAWSKDVEEISDGFLFRLEFEWLESEYTLFDNDLLYKLWSGRLAKERGAFDTARWLLRRCKSSLVCVQKFLLEWTGSWQDFQEADHLDLLSQLKGIYNKIGSRFGKTTPKGLETLKILDRALCEPCSKGQWNIKKMKDLLESELTKYGPK